MTAETSPDYLSAPAARQSCSVLLRAAQDALAGVASQPVTVALDGRRLVSASEVAQSAKNVLVELQFERPAEVHHGIVVLAGAATLAPLFALAPSEDESEVLAAEALLSLGDIVSTFLDTLVGELAWLQPTPRAWLANLEPIVADTGSGIELPPLVSDGSPLSLLEITLATGDGAQCAIELVVSEKTEQILLGLDDGAGMAPQALAAAPPPEAPLDAAPRNAPTPSGDAPAVAPAAQMQPAAPPAPPVQAAQFKPLGIEQTVGHGNSIDLIRDVPLHISVELGRASLTVREILALGAGSVVELDRLAGEPVDVLVNDRLIARGEVVIVDESFGVRVTEILREGARKAAS